MNDTILIATALVLGAGIAFLLIFRKLCSDAKDPEPIANWWRSFSLDKYRPMERLLSQEDYKFLATQPGFRPAIARQLKAQRRRVFRLYLRSLSADFERLYKLARVVMMQASQDRPELALTLIRLRATFVCAMLEVHARLFLEPFGLGPVDVRALVRLLESMRDQLRLVEPQAAAEIA